MITVESMLSITSYSVLTLTVVAAGIQGMINRVERTQTPRSFLVHRHKAFIDIIVYSVLCIGAIIINVMLLLIRGSMSDKVFFYLWSGFMVMSSAIITYRLFECVKRYRKRSNSDS